MGGESLTHLDERGRLRMVDVGEKAVSQREAVAEGWILMPPALIEQLSALKKGNAYEVARLAGIMAAKRTDTLIPLCHGLALDHVAVHFEAMPDRGRLRVEARVRCRGRTGVEMEALTAVSVALLTLYDMGKAVAREMTIEGVRLLEKKGGKSGHWRRDRAGDGSQPGS